MKRTRVRYLAALALAAALTLSACGGAGGSSTTGTGGEVGSGGDLTVLEHLDTSNFDPVRSDTFTVGDIVRNQAIYDVLLYTDTDTGQIEYGTAKSLEPSADFLNWTLTLNEGITFSDGTPYDAEAVKFNIERAADPANSARALNVAKDLTVQVIDPLTLSITLASPNSQFANTMANSFALIASPTAIAADPQGFSRNPVGAGPFLFDEYVQGDRLRVVKNPDYWRAEEPKLDSITFKTIVDPSQATATLQSGSADVLILNDYLAARVKDMPGVTTLSTPPSGGSALMLNNSQGAFSDPRARRAVRLAVDWDAYSAMNTQGVGGAVTTLYAESSPFYDADKMLPAHDADTAQKLFDEIAASGTPLAFTLSYAQAPAAAASAEFIESRLSQYDNVTVTLQSVPQPEIGRTYFAGNFDSMLGVSVFGTPLPYLDQQLRGDSAFNNVKYANPDMDAALDAARAASTDEALAAAYARIQDIYLEDLPYILTSTYTTGLAHTDKVGGFTRIHLGAAPLWQNVGFVQ